MADKGECFISVDVETSGPIPGEYSMLALGACVIGTPDESFYVELKPLNRNAVGDALKITGFDLASLDERGERPEDAMKKLCDWVEKASCSKKPVFVGFNAGFDWSFANWYVHRYVGKNPFGFAPLDIKSYYMGLTGCDWEDTRSSRIRTEYQPSRSGDHNALNDARAQAEMFAKMRTSRRD